MENQQDYLSAAAAHCECVRYSILESYFTIYMQPFEESEALIQACHSIEIRKNAEKFASFCAKSQRGSTLKNLLNNDKNFEPTPAESGAVLYKIYKQNSWPKCIGISGLKKGKFNLIKILEKTTPQSCKKTNLKIPQSFKKQLVCGI